jgi:hypothetical protein
MKLTFQSESRILTAMYVLAARKTKQTPLKEEWLDSVFMCPTPDSVMLAGRSPSTCALKSLWSLPHPTAP